jgi:hypothetical protein
MVVISGNKFEATISFGIEWHMFTHLENVSKSLLNLEIVHTFRDVLLQKMQLELHWTHIGLELS